MKLRGKKKQKRDNNREKEHDARDMGRDMMINTGEFIAKRGQDGKS